MTVSADNNVDETLDRIRKWDVDLAGAELSSTSTARGPESTPAVMG